MFSARTADILVNVLPQYLPEQSEPERDYYVWAYTITITNEGASTVQLRARHWKITDAHGKLHEVKGEGVIGEQPILTAGDSFEYTSGTPLTTPSGFMEGTYQMQNEAGDTFLVTIPAFPLDGPQTRRIIH
ncbi:MAG: Co2+/Mg2+ efflux protein ApaG [Parvibaculaceae bacterium]|nr:Co2+/Mg2+ efflux protein ApaG [Parvibaculaceae bacterium]